MKHVIFTFFNLSCSQTTHNVGSEGKKTSVQGNSASWPRMWDVDGVGSLVSCREQRGTQNVVGAGDKASRLKLPRGRRLANRTDGVGTREESTTI
jgi:hypothetical protein